MKNKPEKVAEIKNYESMFEWFFGAYKGHPVEIDYNEKDGTYKGTLLYYRKDRGEFVKTFRSPVITDLPPEEK